MHAVCVNMAGNMAEVTIRMPQSRSLEDYPPKKVLQDPGHADEVHVTVEDSKSGYSVFISSLRPSTPLVQKVQMESLLPPSFQFFLFAY